MRYATFAGGKRLRPFLVEHSARLFGVEPSQALRAAASIEVLHTYSLVHDDLPCMDDDDLRRGRPTTHIAFDEATAVLAGDALLTIAFEILADARTHPSAEVRCRLIARLAEASGSDGMIGGQMIDMLAPDSAFGAEEVKLLQRLKTGQLFEFLLRGRRDPGRGGARPSASACASMRAISPGVPDHRRPARRHEHGGEDRQGGRQGPGQGQGHAGLDPGRGRGAGGGGRSSPGRPRGRLASYGAAAAELRDLPLFLLDRDA